jgi:hypothetical protein
VTGALDLDAEPIKLAVLRYLSVMGETLTRAADAVEQGNAGRARATEELSLVQVLAHALARRLSEPAGAGRWPEGPCGVDPGRAGAGPAPAGGNGWTPRPGPGPRHTGAGPSGGMRCSPAPSSGSWPRGWHETWT